MPPTQRARVPRSSTVDLARLLGLVALALVVYWPALGGGFVWNDRDYVTAPGLQSLAGLRRIWCEVGATEQYYPVLHSAFWFEHRWFGDAAPGYHVVNLLLHVGSACLLVLILRRLRIPGAWLAAVLFVVHPVYVESVAWIAEQKNTLSLVFYLAALLTYLWWLDKRGAEPGSISAATDQVRVNRITYGVALGFFILALLSKSVTATLPAALLVIVWWQRGRLEWRRDVRPLMPWFMVAAVVGLFTAWVEKTYLGADGADFALSFAQRTLLAGRMVWFYLAKLCWPGDLMFIYPRWTIDPSAWHWYIYLAGLVALVVVLCLGARRTRAPLAAMLFFIGSLFPVLGFLNVYGFVFSYVADHWQYLPSLGVLVLAAAGAGKILNDESRGTRVAMRLVVAAVIAALGGLAWRQTASYVDVAQFYRAMIAKNPGCWMAYNNLGYHFAEAGHASEAIPLFERALELKPDDAVTRDNLGNALRATGRDRDAIACYQQAVKSRPAFMPGRLHLAATLAAEGRVAEAIAQYQEALRLHEDAPEVWNDLGAVLADSGQLQEAATCYDRAVRLKPDFAGAERNLGGVLLRLHRLDEAIAHDEKAMILQPDDADTRSNLGIALAEAGRLEAAINQFRAAVRLQPNSPAHHDNLARALRLHGEENAAVVEFAQAQSLRETH
jgi:protein O-mannosyl-transferase